MARLASTRGWVRMCAQAGGLGPLKRLLETTRDESVRGTCVVALEALVRVLTPTSRRPYSPLDLSVRVSQARGFRRTASRLSSYASLDATIASNDSSRPRSWVRPLIEGR